MTETFYRLHNPDAPCFCAKHAYSALWGSEFNQDGSANRCHICDGTGKDYDRVTCNSCGGYRESWGRHCEPCDGLGYVEIEECRTCEGTGWEPAIPGYSCCWTAKELVEYFQLHTVGDPTGGDEQPMFVVFEGELIGNGFDGEPLAVPTSVVEWITWAELVARAETNQAPTGRR